MQKILIVEDDILQLKQLYHSISSKYPSWDIVCSKDYDCAKKEILLSLDTKTYFSLFLLDIQLSSNSNDQGGFLLSELIRSSHPYYTTPILFLTSITDKMQHALNSYHCYNYIQKPFSNEDILFQLSQMLATGMLKSEAFVIHDTNRIQHRIFFDELLFIEAKNHTLILSTKRGKLLTREYSLNSISSLLDDNFVQCHRKYIINANYIENYDKTNRLVTICHESIPVGRTYQNNLFF